MRMTVYQGLIVLCLCAVSQLVRSDADSKPGTSTSAPTQSERMSRKYYDAEVYSGMDFGRNVYPGQIPRGIAVAKNVSPYRHVGNGVMKKSGSSYNWNVWKGDEDNNNNNDDDNVDGSNDDDRSGGGWQQPSPPQGWDNNNNNAWLADPMTIMLLKNAMSEIKGESKPVGFFSKLTSDPALLLIAASIPISLLLAAVLPTILNNAMGANNIPTVTTTATGNKSRSHGDSKIDVLPYLVPIMEAVGTFGARSIANPDCMQRIFCQVAQDKIGLKSSKYFKKAASVARFLSDGSWLEGLGVKDLVSSLASGHCEAVPCSKSPRKQSGKSKSSQKVHSNSVRR